MPIFATADNTMHSQKFSAYVRIQIHNTQDLVDYFLPQITDTAVRRRT